MAEVQRKILVVDDEQQLAMAVKIRLQSRGYQVATANHGQQALAAIEADRPGFQRDKPFELHGGHAIGVGGFRLVDYFAPDEAVLHEPGKAF
mgnify:CR=1 FL=1